MSVIRSVSMPEIRKSANGITATSSEHNVVKLRRLSTKSAGIIPFCIYNGSVMLLMQKIIKPIKKRKGWNDFGGKSNGCHETAFEIAAREFSEETSCLFYVKEVMTDIAFNDMVNRIKNHSNDNSSLIHSIVSLLPLSKKHFTDKLSKCPMYINLRNSYTTFLLRVPYIDVNDLPPAEDIHVNYEKRYYRECKWFSLDEFTSLEQADFHQRLHAHKIKNIVMSYYSRGMLI